MLDTFDVVKFRGLDLVQSAVSFCSYMGIGICTFGCEYV